MTCHQVILANEIGLVSDDEAEPAESTPDTDITPTEQMADLDSTPHLIEDFNLNGPRLGVYLGRSLMHLKDVALVLSLETGLVSPQFHMKLDSSFKSLKEQRACRPHCGRKNVAL